LRKESKEMFFGQQSRYVKALYQVPGDFLIPAATEHPAVPFKGIQVGPDMKMGFT
jgi:hypothetical protein